MASAVKRIMIEETASWQKPILSIANSGTETKGNRYIVGSSPTGTFDGLTPNYIAWYDGTDWKTDAPAEGWKVYDIDQSAYLSYSGSAWVADADISDKMDLVDGAGEDNLASFDSSGQVKDSGVKTPVFDADLGCILMEFIS